MFFDLPKSYVHGDRKLVMVVHSRNSTAQTTIFPESTRDKPLKNGRSIPFSMIYILTLVVGDHVGCAGG